MKALLAMSPKLPQASDLKPFSKCLDFLKSDYNITWVDPLEKFKNLSYEEYTEYWKHKIHSWVESYDAFLGFSLGAILLQDNLNQFANRNKIIILFSPPSIIDEILKNKLSNVLSASRRGQTKQAIEMLHQYVFLETHTDYEKVRLEPWSVIASRVEFGLGYVLEREIPNSLKECETPVYQLVGEESRLVTKNNVFMTPKSTLQVVPNAGNRILEDNPAFSQAIVKEWLHVKP
ncbi:MAG: hypothetical protein HYX61_01935 [Gammaproteobacteria bacterium]|jgi:pimeloyl-ACP methyl ester carboxylesterase|nr:hypothetical protein [Gammaproteobacteria bacterium]